MATFLRRVHPPGVQQLRRGPVPGMHDLAGEDTPGAVCGPHTLIQQ